MDFCKACGKLAHRLMKGGKCHSCSRKSREDCGKDKPKLQTCGRCNKVTKLSEGGMCHICKSSVEGRKESNMSVLPSKESFVRRKRCISCGKTNYEIDLRESDKCEKCYQREYARRNKGKKKYHSNLRRANKQKATPDWLTTIDRIIIQHIYDSCPQGYHVDHIVPLKGKTVCGLHVPWNLRCIPDWENLSKGNKSWPNMWDENGQGQNPAKGPKSEENNQPKSDTYLGCDRVSH